MKAAKLIVSPGPHWHTGARMSTLSIDFMVALLPAMLVGLYRYGTDALGVIGLAVSTAMLAELGMQKLLRRPVTLADGSAAVSGLLLALILPAGTPFFVVMVASASGIIIGKQVFGGLGASPLNPALVGWAIVTITKPWAGYLDFDLMLLNYHPGFVIEYPLSVLKAQGVSALSEFNNWDLFLGRQTGGIGASAIVWVLIGGLYLTARGTIRWMIPLSFLAGVTLAASVFHWIAADVYAPPLFHLLTGNVIFGAFFLSTHHSSSPVQRCGMLTFGLCAGTLTMIFRAWSVYPDGVVFACLLMSLFVPLLDRMKPKQLVP